MRGASKWCLGVKLWTPTVKVHSSACSSPPSRRLDAPCAAPDQPTAAPAGAGAARHTSDQREVFTIWMKSLVLNGSGCTVFDSGGRIVYRVDNYRSRRSVDVCLMDITGSVVLQVLKKFGRWEGYRRGAEREAEALATPARALARALPWFTVVSKAWGPGPRCEFTSDGRAVCYRMGGGRRKQRAARASRIVDDATGLAVAEVKRKLTVTGVALGDDVLTLVVEPNVDHSLIMGLLVVHGLTNHTM